MGFSIKKAVKSVTKAVSNVVKAPVKTVTSLAKGDIKGTDTPVTDIQTDGLLQYVSDLRTRKARRNRASTNNTAGSVNGDANKLSGATALGV